VKAALIVPGKPSLASVAPWPVSVPGPGELLVEGLLVGVCGTDVEIVRDGFGTPPPGRSDMVLFHESLGRVLVAAGSFSVGDLVAGVVRRPDPVPCSACAASAWDFCRNGLYTERGIKGLDGYGMQQWTVPTEFAVKLDPSLGDLGVLTEPCSVVAKAWAQALLLCRRSFVDPRSVVVTGAGPIGLLAALLGVQQGLTVHVVDLATSGPKPDLVRALGASYYTSLSSVPAVDVAIECTGAPSLVASVSALAAVTVLTGISGSSAPVPAFFDSLVMGNRAVVGSVNAGFADYSRGAAALAAADRSWLAGLITRRVPLDRFVDAFSRAPDDVKVVVSLGT